MKFLNKIEDASQLTQTTSHRLVSDAQITQWAAAYTHSQAAHAPSGAEVNQNAFSSVVVAGQTTVAAASKTASLSFVAGSNVTITTDNVNKTVTFASVNTTYSTATTSTLGLVKIGYAANAKNYPVELSSGQMFVNVPWTNTTYSTFTTAAAGLVPAGGTGTTKFLRQDGTWVVPTDTNTWRGIDSTPVSAQEAESISSGWAYTHSNATGNGAHVPSAGTTSQYLRGDGTWATPPDTNTTYSAATTTTLGLIKLGDAATQTTAANSVTTTASRTYAVQVNASGQAVVNVPWSDTNTTYTTATSTTNGLIKLGSNTSQSVAANAVTATASRTYAVQLNTSGQAVVNVPWVDTNTVYTHPAYTAQASGLYKVTVDATGHVSAVTAVVKADITALGIPASDTNTTYSAGNGLTLTTTTFALGTPSTLTTATSNAVTAASHTHAITSTVVGAASTLVSTDASGNITAATAFNMGSAATMRYNATSNTIDFIFT